MNRPHGNACEYTRAEQDVSRFVDREHVGKMLLSHFKDPLGQIQPGSSEEYVHCIKLDFVVVIQRRQRIVQYYCYTLSVAWGPSCKNYMSGTLTFYVALLFYDYIPVRVNAQITEAEEKLRMIEGGRDLAKDYQVVKKGVSNLERAKRLEKGKRSGSVESIARTPPR